MKVWYDKKAWKQNFKLNDKVLVILPSPGNPLQARLNAVTKSDSFPIPRIDDCIDKIGHAKFVSKLDLLKGFW